MGSFGSTYSYAGQPAIDPVIAALLPVGLRAMTPKEISGLQEWFGADGKFPAVHIGTGEVRGV